MQTQPLIPDALESDVFVEIQATSRDDAERVFGAVFDQPEDEVQHG
jgi:hypothetical protein